MRALQYLVLGMAGGSIAVAQPQSIDTATRLRVEFKSVESSTNESPLPMNESDLSGPSVPPEWTVVDGDILIPLAALQRGTFSTNLWPNGLVPFQFAADIDPGAQAAVESAMATWESLVNVQFIPRTNQFDYVFIQNSDTEGWSNSAVGRSGGRQIINAWREHGAGTFRHELAHTLGFWHEQSRPDRDTFVYIHWDRISLDRCGGFPCWFNFMIEALSTTFGPYDFDSIMHYNQCSWSTCGVTGCSDDPENCRTITVLPPNEVWQDGIGASNPSFWDQRIMSFLYPESNWRFIRNTGSDVSNAGTFLSPWESFSQGYSNTPLSGLLWILEGRTIVGPRVLSRAITIRTGHGPVVFQ